MAGIWDHFWKHIDTQLEELRTARSAADVVRICPATPGMSSGDGFFAGGGGDVLPDEPLREAGWTYVWEEAPFYWAMYSPAGDFIEYVEGDIYAHTTAPRPLPHGQ